MDSSPPAVDAKAVRRKRIVRWSWIAVCSGAALMLIFPLSLLATAWLSSTVRRKLAELDATATTSAVDVYTLEHDGRAPNKFDALVTPDENGRTYLQNRTTVPRDPWGNFYRYEPPTHARGFRVYSLGKDGKPGGEGDDADVDNFALASEQYR